MRQSNSKFIGDMAMKSKKQNRRDFIQTAAAGSVALAFSSFVSAKAVVFDNTKPAIVGGKPIRT